MSYDGTTATQQCHNYALLSPDSASPTQKNPSKGGENLLPSDSCGARLCSIFQYHWKAILRVRKETSWQTLRYKLRSRVLWDKWQRSDQLVGVRFGAKTYYAMLDIDAGSKYRDRINEISAVLESVGIARILLTTSSDSGGVHLWIPFEEEIPTFRLAVLLKNVLNNAEFEVEPGQLEVFPNTKQYGAEYNGHRLPLQPESGSYLLDADHQPISAELSRFFEAWDMAAQGQDLGFLEMRLSEMEYSSPTRETTDAKSWQGDLERTINQGWTRIGQTNKLLGVIVCYGRVFRGLADAELATWASETAKKLPGFDRWCRHKREIERRCRDWSDAAMKRYWPMSHRAANGSEYQTPVENQNNKRRDEARDRINQAMTQVPANLGVTDLGKAVMAIAGVSSRTLYKHRDLWHPIYQAEVEPPATEEASDAEVENAPKFSPCKSFGKFYTLPHMKGVKLDCPWMPQLVPRLVCLFESFKTSILEIFNHEHFSERQFKEPAFSGKTMFSSIEWDALHRESYRQYVRGDGRSYGYGSQDNLCPPGRYCSATTGNLGTRRITYSTIDTQRHSQRQIIPSKSSSQPQPTALRLDGATGGWWNPFPLEPRQETKIQRTQDNGRNSAGKLADQLSYPLGWNPLVT